MIRFQQSPTEGALLVYVINKPEQMDLVAMSAQKGIQDLDVAVDQVRTFRKYCLGVDQDSVNRLAEKVLANDAITGDHGPLQLPPPGKCL